VHTVFLSIVLAENAFALLFRRRHPVGALVGVLAAYFVFDALKISLLPIALAVATVATSTSRRVLAIASAATALVMLAVPVHRDHYDFWHTGLPLLIVGAALAVATYVRTTRVPTLGRFDADVPASTFES
jgi:CBS-domain-containing membrane protein